MQKCTRLADVFVTEYFDKELSRNLDLGSHENCEGSALVELAVDEDAASHLFDDSLADTQAEACSLPIDIRIWLVKLVKVNEEFVEVLFTYTDPPISDLYLEAYGAELRLVLVTQTTV